jgi:hypothetical protein
MAASFSPLSAADMQMMCCSEMPSNRLSLTRLSLTVRLLAVCKWHLHTKGVRQQDSRQLRQLHNCRLGVGLNCVRKSAKGHFHGVQSHVMCELYQGKDGRHKHDADCAQPEQQLMQLRPIQCAVLQLVRAAATAAAACNPAAAS